MEMEVVISGVFHYTLISLLVAVLGQKTGLEMLMEEAFFCYVAVVEF